MSSKKSYGILVPLLFVGCSASTPEVRTQRTITPTAPVVETQTIRPNKVKDDFYNFLEKTVAYRKETKGLAVYHTKTISTMLPLTFPEFKRYQYLEKDAQEKLKEQFLDEATDSLETRVRMDKESLRESISVIFDYSIR